MVPSMSVLFISGEGLNKEDFNCFCYPLGVCLPLFYQYVSYYVSFREDVTDKV